MKTRHVSILIVFLSLNLYSQEQIIGKWLPEDKMGHIEIYKTNEKYYGKIVCIVDPINLKTGQPWKDKLNPDKSKQERNVLGITMMFDFEYNNKTREFVKGRLYDVRTGRTYKGKMWLDNGHLILRGYWLFFYKTEKWIKVKNTCG